jgi:hypothetical protein
MSAVIGQRVFAVGGNQVYLSLRQDEYIRPLAIGSDWTWLKIGLLFNIVGPPGTLAYSDFGIGVCNYSLLGPQGLLSWSCPNWYGRTFNATAGGIVTYTGGANPYYNMSGTYRSYRQFKSRGWWGGNVTTKAMAAGGTGALQRRSMHVVEIVKGTDGTRGYGTTTAGLVVQDWTFDNLLEITEMYNQTPYVGATAMQGDEASGTGAQNDNAGPLDAISVAWAAANATLDIYGIVVYRVY